MSLKFNMLTDFYSCIAMKYNNLATFANAKSYRDLF